MAFCMFGPRTPACVPLGGVAKAIRLPSGEKAGSQPAPSDVST
jgi:hypothetical protein